MNILIVSATTIEITPLVDYLKSHWIESPSGVFTKGNCTVQILVTGVGMHRMAFALGRRLMHPLPDFCVNAGIAGAFPGKAEIGDIVHVTSEIIADLGSQDAQGNLISIENLGLPEDISSINGLINKSAGQYPFLKSAQGITVNTSHGNALSIAKAIEAWDPDVETMEGGAFFYSCLKVGIPFIEIRAISNLVEPRNQENWNIPLAVTNLNKQLVEMIEFFVG
jgi:futalosine hydrolase